ncbi:hypothetical protein KSP40_PGU001763 [Platanthera guangdongensis]|uniref:RNase H type-1 domain-containing protein n=1 Tax=Platanthera guangdongensis TaxID=2320717 RepID=A0ABR2M384_9ASPA
MLEHLSPLGASLFFLVPPSSGWIKVNGDGFLLPYRCAGLGIMVQSDGGQHWDAGRVELEANLAIRQVIILTLLEARGIIIEWDAVNVLDFCSNAAWGSARSNSFPGDVDLTFLMEYAAVWFQHVGGGENHAADHCARRVLAMDFVWQSGTGADASFLRLMAEDCRGLEGS